MHAPAAEGARIARLGPDQGRGGRPCGPKPLPESRSCAFDPLLCRGLCIRAGPLPSISGRAPAPGSQRHDRTGRLPPRPEQRDPAPAPRRSVFPARRTRAPSLDAPRPRRHNPASRHRAQVAQLVEHVTENHGVGGSIPSLGTNHFNNLGRSGNSSVDAKQRLGKRESVLPLSHRLKTGSRSAGRRFEFSRAPHRGHGPTQHSGSPGRASIR